MKGLKTINDHLKSLTKENIDLIRQKLNIGIHYNVEVTDSQKSQQVLVSQAFCSALPVAYSNILEQLLICDFERNIFRYYHLLNQVFLMTSKAFLS